MLTDWADGNLATFDMGSGTVTLNADVSATGLSFTSDGYTLVNNPVRMLTLTGASPTISVGSGLTATIGSNSNNYSMLSSANGFSKTGAGTLIINGLNTYSGDTTIADGTLKLTGTTGLPNTTTVNLTASGTVLDLDGTNETIGGLFGTSGSTVFLRGGRLTIGDNNQPTTFSGAFSDGASPLGGRIIKEGSGVLTLTGISSQSGRTTIDGGTISISSDGSLGSVASGNTANVTLNGGTLQVTGTADISTSRKFAIGMNGGAIDSEIPFPGAGGVANPSNGFTINDIVSGSGLLTKTGPGVLRFGSIDTTLSGGISVIAGQLQLNNSSTTAATTFRSNRITIANGASLVTSKSDEVRTGELDGSGAVSINANKGADVVVYALADGNLSGSFLAAGLTVRGIATQTLSGPTTFTKDDIVIGSGATLVFARAAAQSTTSGDVSIRGGTITLDNGAPTITVAFATPP